MLEHEQLLSAIPTSPATWASSTPDDNSGR